jgi:hypothetical protein
MHCALQCLTVAWGGYTYDEFLRPTTFAGQAMNYPYNMLTAVCLFMIVNSASIMLALA